MLPTREELHQTSSQIIQTPICENHGICFCEECLTQYKACKFTIIYNVCSHFDAQCLEAAYSEKYINKKEFLKKLADYHREN